MIIRIDSISSASDPEDKYAAFLATDTGDVCISPPHESLYYTAMLAARVKSLLSGKTRENIKIEYPADLVVVTTGNDTFRAAYHKESDAPAPSRFDDKPSTQYQQEHWGIDPTASGTDKSVVTHNGKEVPVGTARWRAKFKTPFTSQKTFEGIKQQARNVAERATLSDYDTFVSNMVKLVAQLQDDLKTRWDEEKAKRPQTETTVPKILFDTEIAIISALLKYGSGNNAEHYLLSVIERLAGDELK